MCKISMSCPFVRSLLDLSLVSDGYFALIAAHGLKINHRFQINLLCDFGAQVLVQWTLIVTSSLEKVTCYDKTLLYQGYKNNMQYKENLTLGTAIITLL